MPTLEALYRRLMFTYPAQYRRMREDEMVGTLLDVARPGQSLPSLREAAGLVFGGLRTRARLGWDRHQLVALTIVLAAFAAWLWASVTFLPAHPAKVDGPAIIILTACFGGYAWLGASAAARTMSRGVVIAGGCLGLVVGLTWVVAVTLWIAANANPAQSALMWPAVVVGLAVPGVVSGWSARRSRTERVGMYVGMWTGLVAGPTFAVGLYWVVAAHDAFLRNAQELSWSLGPMGGGDALIGMLFLPVACTLIAAIGAGISVSWPRPLPRDAWRGVPGGPLLLMGSVWLVASYALVFGGDLQITQSDYYAPIRAVDSAAALLNVTNEGSVVATGSPVDIARSSDTFVVVFDRAGKPVAGSVLVDGRTAVFPASALLHPEEASGTFAEDTDNEVLGQTPRLGEWPHTEAGGPTAAVAIQTWSGGYVVAGHALQPRFDILTFAGVLLMLIVALVVILNGRPGLGGFLPLVIIRYLFS